MVEYDKSFLPLYKQYRPNSIHIMDDATNVDYKSIFTTNSLPLNLDYLQIDLEVTNRSTLTTLEKLDKEIFDKYKFATVTFEHDIYVGNCFDTRERSREIFQNRGYVCVLKDIHYEDPSIVYEDWYVHPELVDMNYVKQIKERNQKNYIPNRFTEKSIDYRQIEY